MYCSSVPVATNTDPSTPDAASGSTPGSQSSHRMLPSADVARDPPAPREDVGVVISRDSFKSVVAEAKDATGGMQLWALEGIIISSHCIAFNHMAIGYIVNLSCGH